MSTSNRVASTLDPRTLALVSATEGFDHLFSNRLAEARTQLSSDNSPFHLLGLGVCAFLEAALGMETGLMNEAARCLAESEAGSKKQKTAKSQSENSKFPPGIEYEILLADAVVLQGLVHALSESYMGYVQCLYALNNAHSKFTKLYKTVFPSGLDSYVTPATSPLPSRNPSTPSLASQNSNKSATETVTGDSSKGGSSFFGRWGFSGSSQSQLQVPKPTTQPEGPVEELVVSGAAFGFGLFNLVFSLLPAKVKTIVGFLGFQHDRRLALQALAVSAARKDVHAVFAGLTLMTYHGVVLLMAGYQADEAHIIKQYEAIVENLHNRYPDGALWILNRAKILRMTYDPEGAISVLQDGLRPDKPGHFQQADALLVFELAWTLLSQRRYQEAADAFIKLTEMNSWSHATYYTIAAGCYISLGDREKAKELFGKVPTLLDKRKYGGKELPTEVLIKKQIVFYKAKAKRRCNDETKYVDEIKISIAEELGIFWNTHQRITKEVALAHIAELASLTPHIKVPSPHIPVPQPPAQGEPTPDDLDTPDELAVRAIILGVILRTLGDFPASRTLLTEASDRYPEVEFKWIGGIALFELAVLDLKEVEALEKNRSASASSDNDTKTVTPDENTLKEWKKALKMASEKLDKAMSISGNSVDLSSRLDSRVNMLRDEIAIKKEMLGL